MKIKISKKLLETSVAKIAALMSKKTAAIRISGITNFNVSLTTIQDNAVRMRAANLDAMIEITLKCDVKEPGKATVHYLKLQEAIKAIHTPEIQIHKAGDGDCINININMDTGVSNEDFAEYLFKGIESEPVAQLDARQLSKVLKYMKNHKFEEYRPVTEGFAIHSNAGSVVFTAYSNHRKGVITVDTIPLYKPHKNVMIIQKRIIPVLNKFLNKKKDQQVTISVDQDSRVIFNQKSDAAEESLIAPLLDNIEQPRLNLDWTCSCIIDADEFRSKIKSFEPEDKVTVEWADNTLLLSANDENKRVIKTKQAIRTDGGFPVVAVFRAKYLKNFSAMLQEGLLKIKYTSKVNVPWLLEQTNHAQMIIAQLTEY